MGEALLNMSWKLPPDVLLKPKKPVFTIWPFLNRVLLCNQIPIKFQKGFFTMKQLNYQTLQDLNYDGYLLKMLQNVFCNLEKETLCVHL